MQPNGGFPLCIRSVSFSPVSRIHSIATCEGFCLGTVLLYLVSVPFPGFTQLQPITPTWTAFILNSFSPVSRIHSIATSPKEQTVLGDNESFSPVSRIHSIATSDGTNGDRLWAGFSPVSRIHSIATICSLGKYQSVRMFQSRFQDSLNCNRCCKLVTGFCD